MYYKILQLFFFLYVVDILMFLRMVYNFIFEIYKNTLEKLYIYVFIQSNEAVRSKFDIATVKPFEKVIKNKLSTYNPKNR